MSGFSLKEQAKRLSSLTRELSRCCQTKEEHIFNKFGLSLAEGRVLLALADTAPSSPSVIACELGLGRSRVTPLIENLVRKDFVVRHESQKDRRVKTLTLTVHGLKVAREVLNFQTTFHEQLLERFSDEEREELFSVLEHLHFAIEEQRKKLMD